MEIILNKLNLKNFKGIKDLSIDFGNITNVYGENGVGKTTIFDAFNFLLFDKDSEDRTKFNVQPLDENNNPIHHLETEIEAVLNIDGQAVTFRKVYGEKWSKTRGKATAEFKGYESLYYINDVPQKQAEYKVYITNLIDENTFKLVTNPMYFANLNWKKRREILMDIIGDIETDNVVNYNNKLEPIRELLNDGIDNFMKATKEKIRRLKKDRESIPVRIDEANNSIQDHNFEELEIERKAIQSKIDELDEQIADSSKAGEFIVNKRNELYRFKTALQDKEYNAKLEAEKPKRALENEINKIKNSLRDLQYEASTCKQNIAYTEKDIEKSNEELKDLRADYKRIKDKSLEINEDEFICPTCNRPLDDSDIEAKKNEMISSFNQRKAKALEINMTKGKEKKSKVEELKQNKEKELSKLKEIENQISTAEELLNVKQKELQDFNIGQVTTKEIETLKEEINKLEREISEFKAEDNSQLKNKKAELQLDIKAIDKRLAAKELNKDLKARIKVLSGTEKELSTKIAELEGQEILGEEFIRTKVELLEETVNNKFKLVKFKMFNNLVNGGLEECCEPVVNGVPFSSNLNTAAKINAGIDIINTLSSFYNFYAPIFIDNRESVNDLIETESQIINLIVSKDKKLKVEVDK